MLSLAHGQHNKAKEGTSMTLVNKAQEYMDNSDELWNKANEASNEHSRAASAIRDSIVAEYPQLRAMMIQLDDAHTAELVAVAESVALDVLEKFLVNNG